MSSNQQEDCERTGTIKENCDDGTKNQSEKEDRKDRPTPKIALDEEFHSFMELRTAIDKYQKERSVQLIVKDSKLLDAESTRKVIPKVHHLVNPLLMYHSITYCCKCHGTLKQRPNSRIKKAGAKRLNCPMYFRLRLSPDLKKLVIFDLKEEHNHAIDPNTCQMAPRQQVYRFSKLKKDTERVLPEDSSFLLASTVRDELAESFQPEKKRMKFEDKEVEELEDITNIPSTYKDPHLSLPTDDSDSPLDSSSGSSSSDESDEDDFYRIHRHLLPFPIRLIGAAIQSSPELIECSKSLIELQKSNLMLAKSKLMLKTKKLQLENSKLELEVAMMEKNINEASNIENNPDTTIYLHTS